MAALKRCRRLPVRSLRYVSAQPAASPANYRDLSGAEKRVVHRRFWLVPADALEAGD